MVLNSPLITLDSETYLENSGHLRRKGPNGPRCHCDFSGHWIRKYCSRISSVVGCTRRSRVGVRNLLGKMIVLLCMYTFQWDRHPSRLLKVTMKPKYTSQCSWLNSWRENRNILCAVNHYVHMASLAPWKVDTVFRLDLLFHITCGSSESPSPAHHRWWGFQNPYIILRARFTNICQNSYSGKPDFQHVITVKPVHLSRGEMFMSVILAARQWLAISPHFILMMMHINHNQ